jgi:hypothetical protein
MTEDDIARLSVLVSEGHMRLRRCTGTLRSCRQASQKKPSNGCCGTRPRTRRPFTPVVQYMGCAGRSTPTSTTGSTDICSNCRQLVVGDPRARRPRRRRAGLRNNFPIRHCKAPDGRRHNCKIFPMEFYSFLNVSVGKDFRSTIDL